jgi:DNA primase
MVQEDPITWMALIKQGQHVMDYYFNVVLRGVRIHQLEDKKRVRDALFPIISQITDPVEYAHYAQRLATLLRIPFESLKKPFEVHQRMPSRLTGDTGKTEDSVITMSPSPIVSSAQCLFALVCKYVHKIPLSMMLPDIRFRNEQIAYLYKDLRETYNAETTVERKLVELWKERNEEILEEYLLLAEKEYGDLDDREIQLEFSRLKAVLSQYDMKTKQDKLISAIKNAEERDSDDVAAEKLTVQLNALISR